MNPNDTPEPNLMRALGSLLPTPDPTPQLPPVLPGFNLNKYIEENRGRTDSEWLIPRIECADGFSLSVQASRYNYSSPRDNSGPYYQAEVGFPSAKEESLMEYCDNSDKPTETVYGYVPVEIIEKIVDSHGGIALANGIGVESISKERCMRLADLEGDTTIGAGSLSALFEPIPSDLVIEPTSDPCESEAKPEAEGLIQRWKLDRSSGGPDDMVKDRNGFYVQFEDHEKQLAAANSELDERDADLRGQEDELIKLREELFQANAAVGRLRAIFPKICAALGNGACCTTDASIEFLEMIPDEIAAVIKSKSAPSSPDGWRDIETAPKGGGADSVTDPNWVDPPKILLLFQSDEQAVCYWDWYYSEGGNGHVDGRSAWVEGCSGDQVFLHYGEPIGWQPLPKPPTGKGEG